MIPCVLKLGNRGSGKSISLECDLWALAQTGEIAVVLFDRPGKLARDLTGRMAAARREEEVVFDFARPVDGKNLGWEFEQVSNLVDAIERRNEEELIEEEQIGALFSRREVKSPHMQPLVNKGLKYGKRIFRSLPVIPPANKFPKLFRLNDAEGMWMIRHAQDGAAAQVFLDTANRSARDNGRHWEDQFGPAGRVADVFDSTAIWVHDKGSFDWYDALLTKKQVYLDLSGVTADAARTLTILAYCRIIHLCRRHHARTGKPLNVVIVLEEAGALDLVTPVILTAMQELRAAGISVWIVSQTLFDFKDDIVESLLALCDDHQFFRVNAGIERAAQDLAYATWDSHRVHSTRDITYTARHEKITDKRTTKLDGGGENVSEGASYRPIQDIRVDNIYYTPQQHQAEFQQQLTTLQVGQRFIRDRQGVRKESVSMLKDPWFLGSEYLPKYGMTTGERNTMLAIQRIRNRPYYTPPPTWTLPTTPTAPILDATGEVIG